MTDHDHESTGAHHDDLDAAIRPRWSAGRTALTTAALGGAAVAIVVFGGSPGDGGFDGDAAVARPSEQTVGAGASGTAQEEDVGDGRRHRGEEGSMGTPTAKNKSAMYSMEGPQDSMPTPEVSYIAAVGEAFGGGGLGLVGTGRGGGGTGEGTIGLGNVGLIGKGGGGGTGSGYGRGSGGGHMSRRHGITPRPIQAEAGGEGYASVSEQDFTAVADDARSTFSIDVDTASYSNTRRFIAGGQLPPPESVRIEEYVNYFDYDYVQPTGDVPFSVAAEVGPCPWQPEHKLVHIGLQGREIDQAAIPARNLVFLLDVSGSMDEPDKLPLLVRSLELLVDQLRPTDRIGLVVYAGASGVVLPPTRGDRRAEIKDALQRLDAGGSTNGGAGIELAYRLAQQGFIEGGINRVVLATDGDFNVGTTDMPALQTLIEAKRASGVFLSVLGFGRGNLGDSTMELLADKGNGNYAYIDSDAEARKVLVAEAGGTLVTIAKDVKLQVEFNPTEVASWRLVGYDNRRLAHGDFKDDRKDAGEIGAGHTVTALYEIVPVEHADDIPPKVDPMRYQGSATLTHAADTGEVMTIALRYKDPDGETSKPLELVVVDRDVGLASTSDDFRFSAAVTEFGLLLRHSAHAGQATWSQVVELAAGAQGRDAACLRGEFVALAQDAAALTGKRLSRVRTCAS